MGGEYEYTHDKGKILVEEKLTQVYQEQYKKVLNSTCSRGICCCSVAQSRPTLCDPRVFSKESAFCIKW